MHRDVPRSRAAHPSVCCTNSRVVTPSLKWPSRSRRALNVGERGGNRENSCRFHSTVRHHSLRMPPDRLVADRSHAARAISWRGTARGGVRWPRCVRADDHVWRRAGRLPYLHALGPCRTCAYATGAVKETTSAALPGGTIVLRIFLVALTNCRLRRRKIAP
jgi:hypothetical protein